MHLENINPLHCNNTMKIIKMLAAISLLIVGCMVSYNVGRAVEYQEHAKDYEAACLLSDFLRFTIDQWDGEEIWNGGVELKNSYEEYFQDLDDDANIKHIDDLNNYCWMY